MAKRPIMVELRHSPDIANQASTTPERRFDRRAVRRLPDVPFDPEFAPVPLPALKSRSHSGDPHDLSSLVELDPTPEHTTYIVRADIDEDEVDAVATDDAVVGVFSDPLVGPVVTCGSDPPVGDHLKVEALLHTDFLGGCGMDGSGVLVAIVDGGVNLKYLNDRGKNPSFNAAWSWVWAEGLTPGSMDPGHGTMCAFDACIAAPNCTILDVVLGPGGGTPEGWAAKLSNAVKAYAHLRDNIMTAPRRLGALRSLVVSNSWGVHYQFQDYPPTHPSNYTHNPDHPFCKAVASLEAVGADILFAAGNGGTDCPPVPMSFPGENEIFGANGLDKVLTVAGVDTNKQRVGYSTTGPAVLTHWKPDIAAYTHFQGSGVDPADTGTSAATPVVAGIVAAVRSKRPYNPAQPITTPASVRSLLTSTAEDLGPSGFDFQHGYGVVNGLALWKKLCKSSWLSNICKTHPWICEGLARWPRPPIPDPGPVLQWVDLPGVPFRLPSVLEVPTVPVDQPRMEAGVEKASLERKVERLAREAGVPDPVQLAYVLGLMQGQAMTWMSGGRGTEREGHQRRGQP